MLDAPGHHEQLARFQQDPSIPQLHDQPALEDQKKFVHLGVGVPVEGARELGQFDVLIVYGRDNPR